MALDGDNEIFMIHLIALAKPTIMQIYLSYEAQVILLISMQIYAKYYDFLNIFPSNSAAKLPEYNEINNYYINLLKDKQPPYSLIYSLEFVELETLKIYIEANLVNGFIGPSKSLISTLILFIQKKNGSFHLCINCRGLNKLIIKNYCSLLLIGESTDCLNHAKHFTQLDLINAYHQIRIWKGEK